MSPRFDPDQPKPPNEVELIEIIQRIFDAGVESLRVSLVGGDVTIDNAVVNVDSIRADDLNIDPDTKNLAVDVQNFPIGQSTAAAQEAQRLLLAAISGQEGTGNDLLTAIGLAMATAGAQEAQRLLLVSIDGKESTGNDSLAALALVAGTSADAKVDTDTGGTWSGKLRGLVAMMKAWTRGAGAVTTETQRITLASDDPAVAGIGGITDAKVATDTNGSLSAKLRGVVAMLAAWTRGPGAVTAETQRITFASDDPVVAVLGATNGAAIITDAAGTVQQYLRGIIKLILAKITVILDAGEAHIGEIGGRTRTLRSSVITRPGDTTAYAINDAGGDGTPITIAGCARINGGSGILLEMSLWVGANQTTKPQYAVYVFDAAPSNQADNAQLGYSDADAEKLIGVIPLTVASVTNATAGDGGSCVLTPSPGTAPIGFQCAGGSTSLSFQPVLLNAYSPVASENYRLTIKVAQD